MCNVDLKDVLNRVENSFTNKDAHTAKLRVSSSKDIGQLLQGKACEMESLWVCGWTRVTCK